MRKDEVAVEEFGRLDLRVGTIVAAELNAKARKPAYVLTIDFGDAGVLTSSAQLTENYAAESLVGRQVVGVVNFPRKLIAGVRSECLVLGAVSTTAGVVLLAPDRPVENGTPIG